MGRYTMRKEKRSAMDRVRDYEEDVDGRLEMVRFYEEVWPKVKELVRHGDVEEMFQRYAPMAVVELGRQMMNGGSEKVRAFAAVKLMEMAKGKPVSRSISLTKNLDSLPEKELDALLRSEIGRLRGRERRVLAEVMEVEGGKE